jgi:hypothetical protein
MVGNRMGMSGGITGGSFGGGMNMMNRGGTFGGGMNTMQMGRGGTFGGGMNTMGRGGMGMTGTATGTTTGTLRPAPLYKPDSALAAVVSGPRTEVPAQLRTVIANASSLPNRSKIKLEMVGGTLVMSGEVATDSERALAETLLRFEPGVYNLQNQLTIPQAAPPAVKTAEPPAPADPPKSAETPAKP